MPLIRARVSYASQEETARQLERLAHRPWHGRPRPCRNFLGCVSDTGAPFTRTSRWVPAQPDREASSEPRISSPTIRIRRGDRRLQATGESPSPLLNVVGYACTMI